jgi:hypothetical protein
MGRALTSRTVDGATGKEYKVFVRQAKTMRGNVHCPVPRILGGSRDNADERGQRLLSVTPYTYLNAKPRDGAVRTEISVRHFPCPLWR